MSDVPRPLLRKRADIAHALKLAEDKSKELRGQLETLDAAIRILSPGWRAPEGVARKRPVPTRTSGRHGDIGSAALQTLKTANDALTASEIAAAIAKARQLPIDDGHKRKRLVSAVLSAMRRFEAKKFVQMHRGEQGNVLRWSLRR